MIVRTTDPLNLQDIPANKRAVGDAYPSADVEAIDSNAIALHFCEYFSSQVYPMVDDVEREWVFGESSLDFVRAGHLVPSIGNRPRLFAQSLR